MHLDNNKERNYLFADRTILIERLLFNSLKFHSKTFRTDNEI